MHDDVVTPIFNDFCGQGTAVKNLQAVVFFGEVFVPSFAIQLPRAIKSSTAVWIGFCVFSEKNT